MTKTLRRTYDPEFKLRAAELVLDHDYSFREAAMAVGVASTTLEKWVYRLREERQGFTPKGQALTKNKQESQRMAKIIHDLQLENEILKKALALLASDSIKN